MILLFVSLAFAKPLPPPPANANEPTPLDGQSQKLDAVDDAKYLHYAVGRTIDAPPDVVWAVLTDAPDYTKWNSTVVSLDGTIAAGEQIKLVSKISKRTFKLTVSTFDPPRTMVWSDGGKSFLGVRTFTLTPTEAGGTEFTMKEVFTGSLMKMIAPKLPDFGPDFEAFARDLEAESERRAAATP
jgi:uncharacterized protein YndB with AHSA1/START domain